MTCNFIVFKKSWFAVKKMFTLEELLINCFFPLLCMSLCSVVVVSGTRLYLSLISGSGQVQTLPPCVSEIRIGENLWQWSRLEISLNRFCRSTIPPKQFIIFIIIAKFDTKEARFQEINRSLDYPTFPEIRLNIPRNLLKDSPESFITFCGIFNNISPESSGTFPGIFPNIPRNAKMKTFPGILVKFPAFPAFMAFRSPFLYSRFYK